MHPEHLFCGENIFNAQSNKNLPIITPIQMHPQNIAKAAIIIKQIGEKSGIM
jgi:hypothetical protein